jgi:hypothetical protein
MFHVKHYALESRQVSEIFSVDEKESRALDTAVESLKEHLAEGPVASIKLEKLAQSEGIAHTTLQRERKEIGV